MSTNGAKIERLQRHFGGHMDRETLEAVLAVCEGDVQRAITFMTASSGQAGYDPARLAQQGNETSVPSDYPAQQRRAVPVAGSAAGAAAPRDSLRRLFLRESTLREHYDAQRGRCAEYTATLLLLLHQGVEVLRSCRPKVLAAAWARHDHALADHLLAAHAEMFALPQVLAALELLDARRQVAQLQRKLAALQQAGCRKATRLGMLRSRINDLQREEHIGSLSGALAKHVRAWVRTIPAEQLAFFALAMPAEPWRQLADLVHLSQRDFPAIFSGQPAATAASQASAAPAAASPATVETATATSTAPATASTKKMKKGKEPKVKAPKVKAPKASSAGSFLGVIFGEEAAEGSLIHSCQSINAANLMEVLQRFPVPYSFLRTQVKPIPDEAKPVIARYMSLDHLIWYYEELACPEVNVVLLERLRAGETPKFSYGKLVERLLYFRSLDLPFVDYLLPVAEERLRAIQLHLESPVVVYGDASYSMDVAIRCSTIIGSVLACLTNADLKFFNDKVVTPPVVPRNIAQVLEVTRSVRADGMTAPAVVLWPLLNERRRVKFIVMVTDEVENVKSRDAYFPTLYARYIKEVAPDCTAVFVSFLENPSFKGRMVTALENLGVTKLIQFRLDGNRPDLTKLDALLGLLSTESETQFPRQVRELVAAFERGGIKGITERLKSPIIEQATVDKAPAAPAPPAPVAPKQAAKTSPSSSSAAASHGGAGSKAPAARAEERSTCVVCLERPADTALLECGHLCCCTQCGEPLTTCPVCRRSIVRKVRIFLS